MSGKPRFALMLLASLFAAACTSSSTSVAQAIEVVIGSGDGQFGVVGSQLLAPLRVVVRSAATGQPRRGITIMWDVIGGDAELVGPTTVATDSTGSAEVRVRLGSSPGAVGVRATATGQTGSVQFQLFGVDRPTLDAIEPSTAAPGDTVTLTGSNFSPVALQDVVLFSGIRGQVVSANGSTLRVVVPNCLPARGVSVHVQLGSVASQDTLALTVTGGGETTELDVGEVLDVVDEEGLECHLLPGGTGVSYLTLVYSASTVGAARHSYRLTALSSAGGVPPIVATPAQPTPAIGASQEPEDHQAAWDRHLRGLERELIRGRTSRDPVPARVSSAAAPPVVGQLRSFQVLNAQNGFDEIGAVARSVGSHAAIFVDTLAPAGGFTTGELDALAARFDNVIHPRVTTSFGAASDLDDNDRIVILFTPVVNSLTPPASASFVGGFFYGVDLLPTIAGSNAAEVFYAIVPDPTGIYNGNERPKSEVARVVPAILAHEFQHMVHFNQRILVRNGTAQEALWLSEALAQMAEEMVYRDYLALGDTASQTIFRSGTRQRARLYLQRPDTVSVIVSTGQGSLTERGAGFLNLLYVEDQLEGDVLARLTQTTRTGVANVEAVTGWAWEDLLADWWSAVYLDLPFPAPGPLQYPDVDLRGFLSPFPLGYQVVGSFGATLSGSLWSSSAAYFVLTPGSTADIAVRLGGFRGAPVPPHASLRLRVVRIS